MPGIRVVRAEPVDPPIEEIVLTLTLEEATYLRNLLSLTDVDDPATDTVDFGLFEALTDKLGHPGAENPLRDSVGLVHDYY